MSLFGPPDVAKLKANGDVKGLIKALGYEKDPDVCKAAEQAFAEIGAPAVEPLIDAVKHERHSIRLRAAAALAWTGDARAVEPLMSALKDDDSEVRLIAALVLERIGDARAVEPLIDALKDEDKSVRVAVVHALGRVGDTRAAQPLLAALEGRDPGERYEIVEAMGAIAKRLPETQAEGAPQAAAPAPAAVKYEIVAPEKTQKAIDLAEDYIGRGQPADATMQMLGVPRTKPMYSVVQGAVRRESQPQVDVKIVSVVSCLPDEDVAMGDTAKIARMAFDAIQHYASLAKVQALFLLPYRLRANAVADGSPVPPEETCRVYSAVENLLLEIYDELPSGGTITDGVVEQKVDELIKSIQ